MSDWAGRQVLVTGAAGFIGSHLAERLVELGAARARLLATPRPASRGWLEQSPSADALEFVSGDISDRDVIARAMAGRRCRLSSRRSHRHPVFV